MTKYLHKNYLACLPLQGQEVGNWIYLTLTLDFLTTDLLPCLARINFDSPLRKKSFWGFRPGLWFSVWYSLPRAARSWTLGDLSPHIHSLLKLCAEQRVAGIGRAEGWEAGPGVLGRVIGEIRQGFSATVVGAAAMCFFERLAHLGPGARAAAERRQLTVRLEERRRREREAYFLAHWRPYPKAAEGNYFWGHLDGNFLNIFKKFLLNFWPAPGHLLIWNYKKTFDWSKYLF